MRTRSHIAAALCAVAFATAGLAWEYNWTGNVDSDWDDSGNWDGNGVEGYPDDTNDDAILPVDPAPATYDINLVTVEIDDLTIYTSYDFTAAGGSPVLTVDSLNINGGASETAIVVKISGAEIRTHTPQ